MKILIDLSSCDFSKPGGREFYSQQLLGEILKFFEKKKDYQFLVFAPKELVIQGMGSARMIHIHSPNNVLLKRLKCFWIRAVKKVLVLVSFGGRGYLLGRGRMILVLTGVPDELGGSTFAGRRLGRRPVLRPVARIFTKRILQKAEKIIVPWKETKRQLVKLAKLRSGAVEVVIPDEQQRSFGENVLAFDHKISTKGLSTAEILAFFEIYDFNPTEDDFMLFVGDLEESKNLERIVAAFEKFREHHPEWRLVLAGAAGRDHRRFLKFFQKVGAAHQVVVPGFVNEEELDFLLERCQFLVNSTLETRTGLGVLKAFCMNKAIILSDETVNHEIAEQAAYFVNPRSVDDIKQAMMELAANEKMRKMLTGKGEDRLKALRILKQTSERFGALVEKVAISAGK